MCALHQPELSANILITPPEKQNETMCELTHFLPATIKMSSFTNIAQEFTNFYYNLFDHDRKALAPLYRNESMLTFETASIKGAKEIVEKLGSLPFEKVKHDVATLDAQPSGAHGGILILVTGRLLLEEEERPISFTQVFQLIPDGAGSYFIYNDIFKLVFGSG